MSSAPGAPSRLWLTSLVLVLVNLLPLAGVLFFGWSVYEILLLFWAENLVIGLFTISRFITLFRRNGEWKSLLLIPFFCLHYGTFTLVHGVFVVAFFRPEDHLSGQAAMALWIPFLALLLSHGVSYVMNFLGNREYRDITAAQVMVAPYSRVIVLHVTILGGGFVVMALGQPVAALVMLVVLKIGIDLIAHRKSHAESETRKQNNAGGDGNRRSEVFRNWD